jgi:hypothetical protein
VLKWPSFSFRLSLPRIMQWAPPGLLGLPPDRALLPMHWYRRTYCSTRRAACYRTCKRQVAFYLNKAAAAPVVCGLWFVFQRRTRRGGGGGVTKPPGGGVVTAIAAELGGIKPALTSGLYKSAPYWQPPSSPTLSSPVLMTPPHTHTHAHKPLPPPPRG